MNANLNKSVPESTSHLSLGQGLKRDGRQGFGEVVLRSWSPSFAAAVVVVVVFAVGRAQTAVSTHDDDEDVRTDSGSALYSPELQQTSALFKNLQRFDCFVESGTRRGK